MFYQVGFWILLGLLIAISIVSIVIADGYLRLIETLQKSNEVNQDFINRILDQQKITDKALTISQEAFDAFD